MIRSLAATAAMLSLAGTAVAGGVLVDFDTDSNGNALTAGTGFTGGEYVADGVTISTNNPNNNPMNLYDTDCFGPGCSDGDADLATGDPFNTPSQGNVLIIQDIGDNPIGTPDDDEDGGVFTFDFSSAGGVDFTSIGLLDLDENVAPIFTVNFLGGGTQTVSADTTTLVNPGFPGDNSMRVYTFDLAAITSFSIELPSVSGAITGFEYENVPAPAGLALLGIAAMASGRRRG